VLGGGGLLAAFPAAYAVLMPALYIPIILMLLALIFRGVAFEFRHHGRARGRPFWTAAFFGGSLAAAAAQGLILGGFIQGVRVEDGQFAGGPFDWFTPFGLLAGLGVAAGYALLGACWLIFKAEGALMERARAWARRAVLLVALAMAGVSVATLSMDPLVTQRWGVSLSGGVDWAQFANFAWLPLLAGAASAALYARIPRSAGLAPYGLAVLIFALAYAGLAISLWPYIVPFEMTPHEAAAADNSLSLMLIGTAIMLPIVLAYTIYVYWLFRAKVSADGAYH
jgi:cytochrome bd ubiquinol oxidase subunit II